MATAPAKIESGATDLVSFLLRHPRCLVLTGAGCSVASGIPEYRDHEGSWKSRPPVRYAEFVGSAAARRRYWARSLFGWERIAAAAPNAVHRALSRLEHSGRLSAVVTQNVDALHQRAGSRRVIDLHGRLDEVECLDCAARIARADLQEVLLAWNREFVAGARAAGVLTPAAARPDGDAQVEADFSTFRIPDCPACGGLLKPAVVFFGENVPSGRVQSALQALERSDGLLVVGSSLMVFSGYRFCLAARGLGKPVAAVNLGRTRADEMLSLKVVADCGDALEEAADALGSSS